MKKIRVGFLGCGAWARKAYLPLLKNDKSVQLVSLSGISGQSLKKAKIADYGFTEFYTSWKAMIKLSKLDLVIITTPHAYHYEQIRFCLINGVNVHVDKPPALHAKQVKELILLAQKNSCKVSVHCQRRFNKHYLYMRDNIIVGKLGDIQFVQGDMQQQLYDDFFNSWRSMPELAGGGIMFDSGYHLLDVILFILGSVKAKSVKMVFNKGTCKSDAFSNLSFTTMSDTLVVLSAVRGLPEKTSIERVNVIGSKGSILISFNRRNNVKTLIVEHYRQDGRPIKIFTDTDFNFDIGAPLLNLLNVLKGKSRFLVSDLESSYDCVRILELGYRQSKLKID